jgi:hypothetical protein
VPLRRREGVLESLKDPEEIAIPTMVKQARHPELWHVPDGVETDEER